LLNNLSGGKMKILVVDGNSIINRAFYGIRLLSTKEGLFTNGIYGFLNILEKEITEEKPDGVVVAFDLKEPTFRHKQFENYKANRKGMPDELASQMPILKEILDKMDIARIELAGYEADDLIGTIVNKCEKEGVECIVITGDRDDLQLVSDKTVCKLATTSFGKSESKRYTPEKIIEEYGFKPELIIDMKALWGDPSDNIPGVAGVGEKTAKSLISSFGSIENIYENIDSPKIKDSVRKKLIEGKEMAFLSKELATICRNCPIDIDLDSFEIKNPDYEGLLEIYSKLEFRTFAEKLKNKMNTEGKKINIELSLPDIIELGSVFELESLLGNWDKIYIDYGRDYLSITAGVEIYKISAERFGNEFNKILEGILNSGAEIAIHDIKAFLRLFDINIKNKIKIFDIMLAAYLLNPSSSSYSINSLKTEYLGGIESSEDYNPFIIYKLAPILKNKLIEYNMLKLFEEIEMPLAFVLYDMEKVGFRVDKEGIMTMGDSLQKDINFLMKLIYELAGEEFNINSPKQLAHILYEKLHIPAGKKTKTGYRTDADTLEKLKGKYPIVELILKYRQLTKLNSTYVEGLSKVIGDDGRIHTTFHQTVTQTGRISSTEPNLQNIPVRDEVGKELRRMFIAENEDYILLDADYSQIELRVLAHMSGDETMINAFKEKADIHTVTASQVFGISPELVTEEMRRRAKAVNFGIVYGISAFSLAEDIKVTNKEAKLYIDNYFKRYKKIKEFLDKTVEEAKQNGYVTTWFGRRRWLPELKSSNFNIRSFGERAAMNTPIQGTAADIIKIAMIRVHNRLKDEGFKSRLILQVHDELIIEAHKSESERVKAILKEEMESAAHFAVPLTVDVNEGQSWYDAK